MVYRILHDCLQNHKSAEMVMSYLELNQNPWLQAFLLFISDNVYLGV
jgi:hypothetical protein